MKQFFLASLLAATAFSAYAQVTIDNPWARATVPAQPVGAVYMTINSPTKVTLVKAECAVAVEAQFHTMHHHDGVMKMREHGPIEVSPGKPVELAPGGMHLMLMGLKAPLVAGESIDVILTFKDSKGALVHTVVAAPIKPIGQ